MYKKSGDKNVLTFRLTSPFSELIFQLPVHCPLFNRIFLPSLHRTRIFQYPCLASREESNCEQTHYDENSKSYFHFSQDNRTHAQ